MAYLEIIEGVSKGTVVRLRAENFIGRSSENTIALSDTEVSRQHAVIRTKENYFTVTDLGSANGTFVNGRGLHRLVPQPLYEGDVILICSTKMRFRAEGQDPLAVKKTGVGPAMTLGSLAKMRGVGGFSMVLTSETHAPSVSATMDASPKGMFELKSDGTVPTEALADTVKRLQTMVMVSNSLGALTKPETLLEKIMESIFDIFPHADRAFIMLRDKASREMLPVLGRTRGAQASEDFPISRTIINTVVEKKQSILSSDAQKDGRFVSGQSIVNLSIRSLMCAPFICKEELLGVISVDTMSGPHAFDSGDLAMLTSIAGQAAIAIKNADLFSAVEKETNLRAKLSRYLSKDVVEGVIDGSIPLYLGGEKKYGTVFFCDIVGFTKIAESLSALEVVRRLNRYFSITTEIITRHSGTLHKFGGDMIMAFWNVMVEDDDAQLNAIRAGVEMQGEVWKFDSDLRQEEQSPIYLGIGCNTGEFAGGNVGGEDRMEYTVIGDQVNLAQRIESLASRWQVLVAESTYAPAAQKCCAIKLPPAQVKGKSVPIQIYSVRGVALGQNIVQLTIPVVITADRGDAKASGMLAQYDCLGGGLELYCESFSEMLPGSRIVLEFNLHELPRALRMTALVRSVSAADSGKSFSTAILDAAEESAEALQFLRPGACFESSMDWEEMKRY
jgi:class 3 adenylate cyclase/pSer/pThr/pTyr-binding forkhead associated (FHA) protein